jgi:hypothetical protein
LQGISTDARYSECNQGITKRCRYLGWPIAPSYLSPNAGRVAGTQPMSTGTAVHMEPNKLWRLTPYLTYECNVFRQSLYNLVLVSGTLSSLFPEANNFVNICR